MTERLRLRFSITRSMRAYLDTHGFIDLETPMLTKATPEGARDYLVPSRTHPGKFFALPQSPQIFKQLLMIAGFDRYYQIVRCFRDEDLRADRQPEFTQLDIETSFLAQDEIMGLMEELVRHFFREVLGAELPRPFARITYAQALRRYASDKPDLRIALELIDVADLVRDCDFKVFAGPAKDPAGRVAALRAAPGGALARAYDLVLNGSEIGGGSVRIHRQEMQSTVFELLGIAAEEAQKKFGFLLDALKFGAPPHGGIAFGLDRLAMLMAGADSIREVIAFPKTQTAADPLTDAPTEVSEAQLRELHVRVRVPQP